MINKHKILAITLMLFLLMGCSDQVLNDPMLEGNKEVLNDYDDWKIEESPLNGLPIVDNDLLYEDDDTEVESLYVTILPTYDQNGENITFDDLNKIRSFYVDAPLLEVYFQLGDEEGPYESVLQFGAEQANASITMRGHSTRLAPQKSYKIRLSDNMDLWHGQSVLNLNKSPFDPTRILNALAFKLLESIPDITSIQTRFVHLYIKDLTKDDVDGFVDYGYFTHLEQPSKKYLDAHNLDRSGSIYKIENYEFHLDERLKNTEDPLYDKEAFEQIIEIKEGTSHEKLLKMIQDVNDLGNPIENVIDTYFNEDNYLTWLAYNILVGNYDTQTQNYLLYNPNNALTWYFLPWDYDGAFDNDRITQRLTDGYYVGKPRKGIALYWNTILHKRYFKRAQNVDKLVEKIQEVYAYLTPEILSEHLDKYYPYHQTITRTLPDLRYVPDDLGELSAYYDSISSIPKNNLEVFMKSIEDPMPIWMSESIDDKKKVKFAWDYSYDLQGDDLFYRVEVADNPLMEKPYFESDLLIVNELELDFDIKGTFYWRVTILDDKGNYQYPFDLYEDSEGVIHQGVRQFQVVE